MCQVKISLISANYLRKPFAFSYEPEINPGATVRLSGNAVLKVFTTGNLTIIGRLMNAVRG